MLKNNYYYEKKANKVFKDTIKAVEEVKRLLESVELQEIISIKESGNFTANGVTSYYYIEYKTNKVHKTDNMNKNTFKIFNEILPLNISEKKVESEVLEAITGITDAPDLNKVFNKF